MEKVPFLLFFFFFAVAHGVQITLEVTPCVTVNSSKVEIDCNLLDSNYLETSYSYS